ncbi:hypothetical protein HR060_04825 [Catenovulum sp. SM1970]|uniref:hypothetical protein n=1 Tax=Marinifaba aquimaris TaxID=2741323 RepID=UPI001573D98F|nr:hypothetical protein [Marinifaba aquimaris]NTS76186.1 hypothetical protein [Marinifaba aquimaris]
MQTSETTNTQQQDATRLNKAKNAHLVTELHFDLLKQYAWFSSAVIGAVIVLIQLNAIEIGQDVYTALALLSLSILVSLTGQDYIVDSLLKGKEIYQIAKILKLLRAISMFCLGVGTGYITAEII